MKKKFINGFLMVAMFFAASTSFVSCKDNVDDDLSDLYAKLAAQKQALEERIAGIQQNITNIYEITDVVEADLSGVNGRIDSLNAVIAGLEGQVEIINNWIITQSLTTDSIANELNNTNDRLDSLEALVNQLAELIGNNVITGVTIDATHNPVFGTMNIGGHSFQVLSALYGTNTTGIYEFPYVGIEYNVGGQKLFCYLEPSEIGVKPFDMEKMDYITDAVGNAGKVYFTINNTDYVGLDLSKYTFDVENSAGAVAPVKIENVCKSNVVLQPGIFWKGYPASTAADAVTADNGFCEADATIAEKDLEAITFGSTPDKLLIDLQSIQGKVRNLIEEIRNPSELKADKKQAVADVLDILYNLYSSITASVTDKTNTNPAYQLQNLNIFQNADGIAVRKGQSSRTLLTSAIQPLSYNTFMWYEDTKAANWTIEQLEKGLDWLATKINNRWGDAAITAKIVSLNDADKSITVAVGGETANWTPSVSSHYDAIAAEINAVGLDSVNAELAKLLSVVSLGHVATKSADRAKDYLDRLSNYIIRKFNDHWITRAIAPMILFETSNGVDRLCDGMMVNRGTMQAYLTSATFEAVAPAFKKYVAVKDLATGELIQSDLLPGCCQTYNYDLTQPGEYYVILSCVDYYGYVITKKFHVYVK